MIRVAVAAQAPALRAGLHALLNASESVEVVAVAASPAELGPLLPEIDVLMLAAPRLPDELNRLPVEEASPAVLLLSEDVKAAAAGLAGLKRSATRPWGILPLEASTEELLAAVAALHEGLIVISPPLGGEVIEFKGFLIEFDQFGLPFAEQFRKVFYHGIEGNDAARLDKGAKHDHVCDLGSPELFSQFRCRYRKHLDVAPRCIRIDERSIDADKPAGRQDILEPIE